MQSSLATIKFFFFTRELFDVLFGKDLRLIVKL